MIFIKKCGFSFKRNDNIENKAVPLYSVFNTNAHFDNSKYLIISSMGGKELIDKMKRKLEEIAEILCDTTDKFDYPGELAGVSGFVLFKYEYTIKIFYSLLIYLILAWFYKPDLVIITTGYFKLHRLQCHIRAVLRCPSVRLP